MTIAVGVLANDGIVLAADTQLTITNFWKGEGGKIMAVARKHRGRVTGAFAVTGATNRYEYLHGLGDELTKDFIEGLDGADKTAAYERAGGIVRRFHRRHVVPFAHDLPEVNVLIAYQRDGELALWQSSRSVLIEQYDHGAVGIGAFAATSWLNRIWKIGLDVPTSIVVATFAAAVAKESVDGCGKYTHVLIVQGDQWYRLNQTLVNEIDGLYEAYASEIQPSVLLECLGEQPARTPRMTLDQFGDRLAAVIHGLREDTPESVKRWRRRRYDRLVAQSLPQSSTDDPSSRPPSPESPEGSDES